MADQNKTYSSYRSSLRNTQFEWPNERLLCESAGIVAGGQNVATGLAMLSGELGFTYFSCVIGRIGSDSHTDDGTLMISNYPNEWQAHYQASRYIDADPIVCFARRARSPFLWGRAEDLEPLDPLRRQLMTESHSFGIRAGVSIPTHGPCGEFTLLTMISHSGVERVNALVRKNYNLLWMLSPMVHRTVVDQYIDDDNVEEVYLTDHERTCLRWTLQGKTSWEISRIISRSKPTVEYHLQKAMRKFGVSSKIKAAAEGLQRGLL